MGWRQAINEKCKDCIYDPKSGLGTWRQQVEGCTSDDCPLYEYRPKSSASSEKRSKGPIPPGIARYRENQRKLLAKNTIKVISSCEVRCDNNNSN